MIFKVVSTHRNLFPNLLFQRAHFPFQLLVDSLTLYIRTVAALSHDEILEDRVPCFERCMNYSIKHELG